MNTSFSHIGMSFILSAGETAILYWLCSSFLHRKEQSGNRQRLGFFSYFLFQLVTYWFGFPLFSAWMYYCIFVMLVCYFLYTDSLQIKVFVSCLFVVLNYSCILFTSIHLFKVREMVYLFYLFAAVILFCTALSLFYLVDKIEIIDEESEKNAVAGQLLNLQTEKQYKPAGCGTKHHLKHPYDDPACAAYRQYGYLHYFRQPAGQRFRSLQPDNRPAGR